MPYQVEDGQLVEKVVLCDDLKGWGKGGRLRSQGGVCIIVVDLCCCMAEANTTL